MTKCIVGIDFGACNIKAVYLKNNHLKNIRLNKNQTADPCIPNVIYYNKMQENGNQEIRVGEFAAKIYNNENKVTYIKRKLEERKWVKYIPNLGKEIDAEKVTTDIFVWLQKCISDVLSTDEFDVVITVPVCFSEVQRQRIINAARKAKLNIKEVITESFAAIFSESDFCDEEDKNVLVFDFGGSTLDLSLFAIEVNNDVVEIREEASAGLHYGGLDIDRDIYEIIFKEKYNKQISDILADSINKEEDEQELLQQVKELKEEIFGDDDIEEATTYYTSKNGRQYEFTLTKEEIVHALEKAGLKNKIVGIIDDLIDGSDDITKEDISQVKVYGGSSSIDYVRNTLVEYFGESVFDNDDWEIEEIYMSIASGAARYLAIRGENSENYIIRNCIPFNIGLEKFGKFVKYINRNEIYGFETLRSPILISDLQKNDYKIPVYQCFKDDDELAINSDDVIYMGSIQLNKTLYSAKDALLLTMKMDHIGSLKVFISEQVGVQNNRKIVLREEKSLNIGG